MTDQQIEDTARDYASTTVSALMASAVVQAYFLGNGTFRWDAAIFATVFTVGGSLIVRFVWRWFRGQQGVKS